MAKLTFEIPAVPLVEVLGSEDRLLRKLEAEFPSCTIHNRGHFFTLEGEQESIDAIKQTLLQLAELVAQGIRLDERMISETAKLVRGSDDVTRVLAEGAIKTPSKVVRAKTLGQKKYLDAIDNHTITFGIGPAGTGKTYLAVAKAVSALYAKKVSRIILTRPAVEAGERLGFLPGTLSEKIDPYLRPLFDALQEMLEPEVTQKLMETGVIEVAPLAYMRGRTLNDSFIILDEAQNTTAEQMKMFLTRLGFGSKMVVTGDATQIDLPTGKSGLDVAAKVLKEVKDLHISRLSSQDVVRHELVTRIVDAYERAGQK